MAPVALLHWSVELEPDNYPVGFGFLMPRIYDLRVLGTLFPSRLFKDRAPQGKLLLASFYGGMLDPEASRLDDNSLVDTLNTEHTRIFGRKVNAEVVKILRYPAAIPQLLPDHPEKIASLLEITNKIPGLFLAGNYLTGVGIDHAVMSGYAAAENFLKFNNNL